MEVKKKSCTKCKKNPVWKNRTIDGEKMSLCQSCNFKIETTMIKKSKEKLKARKKAARNDKKLHKTQMLVLLQKLARFVGGDTCCTCNRPFSAALLANGGHGIRASKGMSTALLLKNIHEQCSYCNGVGMGEQVKYAKFVDSKYGVGTFDFLERLSNIEFHFSKPDLQELRDEAEKYIKLSEGASMQEKERLRAEFIAWQENTSWYKELTNHE